MSQNNLSIAELMDMSKKLYEENKEDWSPMAPEYGRDFILYMIEEIGEVISVLKKKSIDEIMTEGPVREHMVEELSDVLMYFIDCLNRFNITSEEFSNVYKKKFTRNMNRNFVQDHQEFIHKDVQ